LRRKLYWGCDSEYLSYGRKIEDDVVNIAFSDGHNSNFAYRNADDAKRFLENKRLTRLYVWTLKPEFGTFASWKLLGVDEPTEAVDLDAETIQRFTVVRSSGKTLVLDIQPFFKPLGYGSLEKVGKFLSEYYNDSSLHKVEVSKYDWFGVRKPKTEDEWRLMNDRVKQDARITSRAAEFLETELLPRFVDKPDLKQFYSWGTISRRYFKFPQVNARIGRTVIVKNLHMMIHDLAEFAGRNEAFSVGAIPSVHYLDVSSLYPVSVVASDCLRIADVEPMSPNELDDIEIGKTISKFSNFQYPYCWLYGSFESQDDLWGLPTRTEKRNYYVTGKIVGLYHTYDLQASKAKINELFYGLKPVSSNDRSLHDRYARLTMQKLEGRYVDLLEKHGIKNIANASLGSLGMSKPQPSSTSNFPAYSTGSAMSHLIMSRIFDRAPKPVHYCDTDSLFVEKLLEGKMFDLTDLEKEWWIPVVLESKGYGEQPYIFRPKLYYLNKDVYAVQGVKIEFSDWLRIVTTLPDLATAKRQIKGTIRTKSSKAKELQFGRWYYEMLELRSDDLAESFRADDKRFRETYNSYALCREKRYVGSRSWTSKEFYQHKVEDDNGLAVQFPSGKKISREYIREWLEKYSKSKQKVEFMIDELLS